MSEYIVDYRWLRSRIFGQVEHLTDDLTKIIRCRDCRYNEDESDRWDGTLTELYGEPPCYCMHPDGNGDYMRMEVEPDGFCKWGVPK